MNTDQNILLVESNPAQVEQIRQMLGEAQQNTRSFAHVLIPAGSVAAALDKLRHESGAVILFSSELPEAETIAAIQNLLQAAPASAIIVLDHNQNGDALIQAGAQDSLSWKDLTGSIRYVMERSRIAQAVTAKEQFAQSALDALTSNLAILDENGVILTVNRAWREFAQANGVDPALVSEGVNYLAVCDAAAGQFAEEAPAVASGIRAVIRGEEQTFALEYPCHSETEKRWFTCRVIRFIHNTQARVVVKHENITERRQAEERLAERHAILAAILESAGNPIFSLDCNYRYTSFNQAHVDVMNALYDAEIELGHGLDEYQSVAADWQAAKKNLDRALQGEAFVESAYAGMEGPHRRYFEISHNPIRDLSGSVIGVSVFAQDISKRKRAEKRLELSNAALEASANAIVITDRQGIIQWANLAFGHLTGYKIDEVIGKNPRELVKSEKQESIYYKNLWGTILSGQTWHGELINRRKDGSLYAEEMTITPMRNEQGEIDHFIAIKQDISARKQAEAELKKRAAQLALINEVSKKITSVLDLPGVMNEAANQILTAFGYHHIGLFTLDEAHKELVMRAWAGKFYDFFPVGHRVKWGIGMVGRAAKYGKMQWTNDVASDPHYKNYYPEWRCCMNDKMW